MNTCFADITLVPGGSGKNTKVRVAHVEHFQTEQSIDNDVDSFSVDVGDVTGQLINMLDRDTEIHVNLYGDDGTNTVKQMFTGLVDIDTLASEKTHTLQGSDVPSAILIATDALPGYWRHINPSQLLLSRCKSLGLTNVQIASMPQIGRLWSDASEKEWAFQYRVARVGGCFMWSTDTGRLIVDKLNYSASSYAYSFGHAPTGETPTNWIQVQDVSLVSNKQQRIETATVYGEDKKKKGVVPYAVVTNPPAANIGRWLRKPDAISVLSTARTQKDLTTEANLQIFESIVGAQEYTLTVGGSAFIQQNQMARVNLPEYGVVGHYYVVGVNRSLTVDGGLTQSVRLRERGYALDTRVPTAPKLATQPNLASGLSTASIAEALSQADINWSAAFVRATRKFLTPQGWDFSSALGVLLSICSIESGFRNIREGDTADEWYPMPTSTTAPTSTDNSLLGYPPLNPGNLTRGLTPATVAQFQQQWRKLFANSKGNPNNPYSARSSSNGEAGVGVMQLTSVSLKQEADGYGFGGTTQQGGAEYAGGRWYPESNIWAAAHYLATVAKDVGADPTNFETIWKAVAAYNAGVAGALAGGGTTYANKVRQAFKTTYGPKVSQAASAVQKTVAGSAVYTFTDGDGNTIVSLPSTTPRTVAKAITYGMSLRGQSLYQWGGSGQLDSSGTPRFDCSSFVTECLVVGDPTLKGRINPPNPATGSHGDDTNALWEKGTNIAKTDLLPGDLVFFDGIENGESVPHGHVGMFLGDGEFIADPSTGEYVRIDSLNSAYYRDRYNGARRFFTWPTHPGA